MRTFLLIFFLSIGFGAYAVIDCIVIHTKSDSINIIPLEEAPEITFDSHMMRIGSYDFNLENVVRYEFTEASTVGIESISGELKGFKIDPNGYITVPDAPAVSDIIIVNKAGISCGYMLNGNIIDIHNLPSDVYVIKIGSSSFKFRKK